MNLHWKAKSVVIASLKTSPKFESNERLFNSTAVERRGSTVAQKDSCGMEKDSCGTEMFHQVHRRFALLGTTFCCNNPQQASVKIKEPDSQATWRSVTTHNAWGRCGVEPSVEVTHQYCSVAWKDVKHQVGMRYGLREKAKPPSEGRTFCVATEHWGGHM